MRTTYGLNLSYNTPHSPSCLFSEALRRGQSFRVMPPTGSPDRPNDLPLARLDGEWPAVNEAEWVGVLLFGPKLAPAGAYRLRWEGSGIATLRASSGLSRASVRPLAEAEGAGSIEDWIFDPRASGSLLWVAWRGEVKGLEVRTPDALAQWRRAEIKELRDLQPKVVRTLDWTLVNEMTADQYPLREAAAPMQGKPNPVAVGAQVALANAARAHLHITIPMRGSYSVERYREFLQDYLSPLRGLDRAPILEVGNELWNVRLMSGAWLRAEAERREAKMPAIAAEEINRTFMEARTILKGAMTPWSGPDFFTYVGGHHGNPWFLDQVLMRLDQAPDGAGCAFYFGPRGEHALNASSTADDVIRLSGEFLRGKGRDLLAQNMGVVSERMIRYFHVYECGQGMNCNAAPWRPAMLEAQRSKGMGELYEEMGVLFESMGVDSACLYSYMTDPVPPPNIDPWGVFEKPGDELGWTPKAIAAAKLLRGR